MGQYPIDGVSYSMVPYELDTSVKIRALRRDIQNLTGRSLKSHLIPLKLKFYMVTHVFLLLASGFSSTRNDDERDERVLVSKTSVRVFLITSWRLGTGFRWCSYHTIPLYLLKVNDHEAQRGYLG